MAGKMLMLSFHAHRKGPTVKEPVLDEDMIWKRAAATELGLTDAMDGKGPRDALAENPGLWHDDEAGPYSGLELGRYPKAPAPGATELISFNTVGGNAWWRKPYVSRRGADRSRLESPFARWFAEVIREPVDVLWLAGHHEAGVLWGAEDRAVKKRYYTGIKPTVRIVDGKQRPFLEWRGYPIRRDPADADTLRAGPFDLTVTLSRCRLVVIAGCNGVTSRDVAWRDWVARAAGKPPLVLGWYGLHGMPVDSLGKHFSATFWSRLRGIAPGNDLEFLVDPDHGRRVIREAWVYAIDQGFKSSSQRHLLFEERDQRIAGAGGITSDGKVYWVVNDAGKVEEQK